MASMASQIKAANTLANAIVRNTTITQSSGLRARHIKMHEDGKHLMIDANESEATLNDAMEFIKEYAKEKIEALGAKMEFTTKCSLFDCKQQLIASGGDVRGEIDQRNKKVSMKPDGGIIWAILKSGKKYPVFIGEDKVQGTNDSRRQEGLGRQATGNAIERAAKNIRGSEMLCHHMTTFPYVIFASGCDFHHTETISKRLEMMNMAVPNHYMEVTPSSTSETLDPYIDQICDNIDVRKMSGIGIASIFVKAHKWDKLNHGSSRWRKKEIIAFSCEVIDKTMASIDWEQPMSMAEPKDLSVPEKAEEK
jgi:hypothetical protein